MAKKKIKLSNRITNSRNFSAEGILNCDDLQEGALIVEVEELGEVDLHEYIKQFSGENIKINISNRVSEDVN